MTFFQGLAAVFVAFVGAGLIWTIWEIVLARSSASWPRVTGRIIKSVVTTESDGEGGKSSGADIRSSYSVDGQEYVCDRVRFGGRWSFSWRRPSELLAARHPLNAVVPVSYDPSDPATAVL